MISVREAKTIILANSLPLDFSEVSLEEACMLVNAENLHAGMDIPSFDQSAMDGYALRFEDYLEGKSLQVRGKLQAGESSLSGLNPGQALRIFTGAPLPEGADTVLPQEKAGLEKGLLQVRDPDLCQGANVRLRGSEIREGEIALPRGQLLNAPTLGFLAMLGISKLKIYPRPRIGILVTGKELRPPGRLLEPGQVYEANSFLLQGALHSLDLKPCLLEWVDDDLALLTQAMERALQVCDILLLSGGVSVGDYDFVLEAARQCGVFQLFHKVKQKPGKPLYFGKRGRKLIFGLPGNPASSLCCFYEYVYPCLEQCMGRDSGIQVLRRPLASPCRKNQGLSYFLRGIANASLVRPLTAQESYRLSSFAKANCLIYLEEDRDYYEAGEEVELHMLPQCGPFA